MGKHQEERKIPVIVVKNVELFRNLPYPKKQILSHLYLLNRRQNQYPPE